MISVIICYKNPNERHLVSVANKVLRSNGNLPAFELILVCDDLEECMIKIKADSVKHIYTGGIGLGASMNKGAELASHPIISRIDADDDFNDERFIEQFNFLREHEDVVLIGTQLYLGFGGRKIKAVEFPLDHDGILNDLLKYKFSMAHTSIMFKRDAFYKAGGYKVKGRAQDLDFFLRMSKVGKIANLPYYLTTYNLNFISMSMQGYNERKYKYEHAVKSTYPDRFILFNSIAFIARIKRLMLIFKVLLFGK